MDLQGHFERPEIINNPIYQLLLNSADGKSVLKYYRDNGCLKKTLRNLLSRLILSPEKDRQLETVLQVPNKDILEKFHINSERFIQWSEDIEKLLFFGFHTFGKCNRHKITSVRRTACSGMVKSKSYPT
ncbi:uncharacterized protein [Chelonus insularis]|uniref:uncharacterized protein n=1 Tax=Chelonus insularis TaxID=460826 RepID=UPI00158B2C7A|nr:uncharacterized protein LOC118067062 [Chelonus insularis]